ARRSGTSRGSRIFAKLRRPEAVQAVDSVFFAVREAAKDGPSTGLTSWQCQRRPSPVPHAQRPGVRTHGRPVEANLGGEDTHDGERRQDAGQRKATAYTEWHPEPNPLALPPRASACADPRSWPAG